MRSRITDRSLDFGGYRDEGATLKRRGECFRWKVGAWFKVLQLALAYGWQPMGTTPPRGVPKASWEGGYLSNRRQQITATDAQQLAEALQRAVEDMSRKSPAKPKRVKPKVSELAERYWIEALGEFAAFCRSGAFRITDDVCND